MNGSAPAPTYPRPCPRPLRPGVSFFPAEAAVPEKRILSAEDIRRALTRIAHEVLEQNRGADGLVLLGIRTRGVYLAERLAALIGRFEDSLAPVATGAVDVSLHRDDLASRPLRPELGGTRLPGVLNGQLLVLVDDVLFTGRTVRAGLDAIADFGRPRAVQLAVLVDRGHRELPIRADYVGKNLPTARSEKVVVHLTETDGEDCVLLAPAAVSQGQPR